MKNIFIFAKRGGGGGGGSRHSSGRVRTKCKFFFLRAPILYLTEGHDGLCLLYIYNTYFKRLKHIFRFRNNYFVQTCEKLFLFLKIVFCYEEKALNMSGPKTWQEKNIKKNHINNILDSICIS